MIMKHEPMMMIPIFLISFLVFSNVPLVCSVFFEHMYRFSNLFTSPELNQISMLSLAFAL